MSNTVKQLQTENTGRVGLGLAKALLTPDARTFHLFAFSTALGVSIWHSFIQAPISYRELPRQQFGNLQAKLLPTYFGLQAAAAGGLFFSLAHDYPFIYKSTFDILDRTVWQGFTLLTTAGVSLFNLLVAGPAATKIMHDRHRQEKLEGKDYQDALASEKLQNLTKQFVAAHSLSATLNLVALGGLITHGLWLAKFGFQEASVKRVFSK